MWDDTIRKLRRIEDNLLKNDQYVESYDALLLSSVEIEGDRSTATSAQFLSQVTPTTKLNGLTRLVSDLASVLHEAYIEQQSEMMVLAAELERAKHFSEDNASYLRYQHMATMYESLVVGEAGSSTSSNNSSSGFGNKLTTMSWDENDSSSPMLPSDKQKKAELVHKQLRRSIQDLHNGVMSMLDAKLTAYEVVSSCMESYLRSVVAIAQENGVSLALTRAKRLVQPQLDDLLRHRFLETMETQTFLSTVRQLWAAAFFRNDLTLAERNLVLNHSTAHLVEKEGTTRFKMGAGFALLMWAFSECFNNAQTKIWHDPTFAIFMCFGDLLLLLWMWGVSMRVWRLAGIDFVRILRLEGTEIEGLRTPEAVVYSSATDLSLIFLTVFICFNKAVRGVLGIHGSLAVAHALPTLMVVFFIYRIVYPPTPRRKWLNMLWLVLTAPMNPIIFRDGYIGDLLTSLVRVFLPMCFSIAYLLMSAAAWLSNDIKAAASTSSLWWLDSPWYRLLLVPFVTLMPLWIRLMQCLRRSVESGQRWPHMANALKYSSAIAVISYGTFRPAMRSNAVWIAAFVGATLFQFSWDLTMDWGIVVWADYKDAEDVAFFGLSLRRTRLLGSLWIYIGVICANLVLRFAWALTLLPESTSEGHTFYSTLLFHLGPLVAAGEVLRRMVWGFFRLEWEQLEAIGSPIFEKMAIGSSSRTHKHPSSSGGGASTLVDDADATKSLLPSAVPVPTVSCGGHVPTTSVTPEVAEWVLAAPVLSSIAQVLLGFSSLDARSSVRSRARFVESIFFAGAVLSIILSAAAPEIHMLMSS